MAKNVLLRDENSEVLYPTTRNTLLIDNDGNSFTPQAELTAGVGISIDSDSNITTNLTINNTAPDSNGNFNLTDSNTTIDSTPISGNTDHVVSSDGVFGIASSLLTLSGSVSSTSDISSAYQTALSYGGTIIEMTIEVIDSAGSRTCPMFVQTNYTIVSGITSYTFYVLASGSIDTASNIISGTGVQASRIVIKIAQFNSTSTGTF